MRSELGQADIAPWASVGNLQSHLSAAFGAPFECWRREAGKWHTSHSVPPAPRDVGTWLDALWRRVSPEPQVATLSNGQTWVAAICRAESEPTVVAAQVPCDPGHLAAQLAFAAFREARLAGANISQQE